MLLNEARRAGRWFRGRRARPSGRPGKIPVLMCIDVEPDERLIDPDVPYAWSGFERIIDLFTDLRPRLQAATGSAVHFSWFFRMDDQIAHAYGTAAWVVARYGALIERIRIAGDALGLHVHPWRWDARRPGWILDLADQAWVNHCLHLGFRSFRESLGQPCRYFRFGDAWMNNATLALLERLGTWFDLTVEPGRQGQPVAEPSTGSFPDYREVPPHPYRPARREFREPAALRRRRLWIVPVSTGSLDWSPPRQGGAPALMPGIDPGPGTTRGAPPAVSGAHAHHGAYEGCLDRVDDDLISGWVYDAARPDTPIDVAIHDGAALLTTAAAATFRPDLLTAGKGNGRHSFNVGVPSCLRDRRPHSIHVTVADTDFSLANSPLELTASGRDAPAEAVTLNLSSNPWTVCRIIDQVVGGPGPAYLALVVRSDGALYPEARSNIECTLRHLLSHPAAGQMVFETPAEMIRRWQ